MWILVACCALIAPEVAHAQVPDDPAADSLPGDGGDDSDAAAETAAAPPPIPGGNIPVRLVDGRLIAACDISTNARRIPVNLLIEYDGPWGLRLHNQATNGIRAERDGVSIPVTIHFPGFEIVVPAREHGPEEFYNDFTKYHSKEMGEQALVGSIGAEVLSQYFVTFDLEAGFLRLDSPRPRTEDHAAPAAGTTRVEASTYNGLVWMPARHESGTYALAVGSSTYDTIIDEDLAYDFDRPAGNIGPVTIDELDLSKYVAFRPEELMQIHPDGALGVTGIGLLRHFRVSVDRVNELVEWTPVLPAKFPEEDLEYFTARVTEEAAPVEAFLKDHADSRLAREAARHLVDLRLQTDDTGEGFERAIQWVTETASEDLRATTALDLMEELLESGYPEQALIAGESGVEFGRDDRYPNAIHSIHSRLGEQFLERGLRKKAWKHLLSAAFGLPEDGLINLNLGRFYELEERYNRAYSRYVQAVITPEAGPQALEGLERVHAKLGESEAMSVDTVAKLIAGKTLNFGSATRFKPTPENSSNRVVLVEFFTNAHGRGTLAGELAWDGLLGHYSADHVAFISYHLAQPGLDPLVNPLASVMKDRYSITRPTLVVDGTARGPGAARTDQREALFDYLREMVNARLPIRSFLEIDVEARAEEGRVRGQVEIRGPELDEAFVHCILVERGVLFPGQNKHVVHRMIARGSLTESIEGVYYAPIDGTMTIDFDRALEAITEENHAHLDALQSQGGGMVSRFPVRIDPRQLSVVVYVRSELDGKVLQAAQIDIESADETGQ
ncbi:MAG: hypothetical protein AAF488_08155 [Planctomycetota bacterium]